MNTAECGCQWHGRFNYTSGCTIVPAHPEWTGHQIAGHIRRARKQSADA